MSQSFKVEISVVQAGLVRIYNWEVVEIISCLIFGTQVLVELLWKQFVCGSEWAGFKRIWAQSCLFGFIQSICFANQLYFQFHSSLSVSDFASSICCLEYAFEYYLRSRIFFWVLEFMTFFFSIDSTICKITYLGTSFLVTTSFPQNSVHVVPLSSDIW